jgi:hypothetical protein
VTTRGCRDLKVGALLFAYEIGALLPEDEERFDRHLLECEHCFERVRSFKEYSDMLRADEEVRESIFGEEISFAETPEDRGNFWRHLWPPIPLPFKPALLYLVILILLYPAFNGMIEETGPAFEQVQTISLSPFRATGQESFSMSGSRTGIISFHYPGAKVNGLYTVVITDADETIVFSNTAFTAFDKFETGWLAFPSELMRPGSYRLEVYASANGSANVKQIYLFDITE